MNVVVRPYEEQDAEAWDTLVANSWNGTFLHQRKFLSYHGTRFQDLSLVIEDKRGHIVGVFPAALHPTRESTVTSHPGLTYGGVVHEGGLRGALMIEALEYIAQMYQAMGLRVMQYKVVPYIYHYVPAGDDLYALFRLGAVLYRSDLSATIDLTSYQKWRKGRRSDLSKARRSGVQVEINSSALEQFWPVLEENLATKHKVRPVHTLEEIMSLQNMFPEQIKCLVGKKKNEIVAGVVLFCTAMVTHLQYEGSSALGREVAALTMVLDHTIAKSKEWGARYFDFGMSNEHEGRVLNEGLYQFKASFGAGGVVHEFYELSLGR